MFTKVPNRIKNFFAHTVHIIYLFVCRQFAISMIYRQPISGFEIIVNANRFTDISTFLILTTSKLVPIH